MSEWYKAKESDVDIDIENKEWNIFVKSNDNGNVYITIPFYLIEKIHNHFALDKAPHNLVAENAKLKEDNELLKTAVKDMVSYKARASKLNE